MFALALRPALTRLWTAPPRSGQLWQRRLGLLLPLLAAGDLGIGVWLLWHAPRHHGWDQPGVPVTGVLLLMCALFLGLAGRAAPGCTSVAAVAAERAGARLTGARLSRWLAPGKPDASPGRVLRAGRTSARPVHLPGPRDRLTFEPPHDPTLLDVRQFTRGKLRADWRPAQDRLAVTTRSGTVAVICTPTYPAGRSTAWGGVALALSTASLIVV